MRWHVPWQRRERRSAVDVEPVVGGEAIVLTGGSARGAVQVGMLRALHEAGVRPVVIAGTSVGSLNGAWYAAEPYTYALEELERVWRGMHETGIFRATRRDMVAGFLHRPYLVPAAGLHGVIARLHLEDLSETVVPLRVATTRLDTGAAVIHSSGHPASVLSASCAIPGVFAPVTLDDGALHVDGGVAALAPVAAVMDHAPSRIWLLDATGPVPVQPARTALDMVRAAFAHSIRTQMAVARALPGVVTISVPDEAYAGRESRDFSASAELVAAGYAAGRDAIAAAGAADVAPAPGARRSGVDGVDELGAGTVRDVLVAGGIE